MREPIQYDHVTGLPERGHLWSLLDDSLNMVRRNKVNAGVLLIKLNDLSNITDTLGQSSANKFLNVIGSRIKKSLWDLDTATRFEDDKIVIVANNIKKLEDIHIVMKKVQEYISIDLTINNHNISPSTSIGVVLLPEDALQADEIMSYAYESLNAAIQNGKNAYSYYNSEIGLKIEEQEAVKNSILSTLADESFELMLQPKVDTATREVCGAEALVRMRDTDGNLVKPNEFIPIAESSNLILKIGDWVLKKASQMIKEYRKSGIDIPISINISDVQFKNSAAFLAALNHLLDDEDCDPNKIILEVSENSITEDPIISAAILSEVKSYGFQVSIDGYGIGFTSLSILKDLKVDEIKIDRQFLNDVPVDAKSTAILQSIIMLGKSMDFRVVSVGVETEAQISILKENNCDEFQGFHISEPMNHDKFIEWFNNYSIS